ncbi:PREDICTED: signal peptidase complex subunit 3-like [Priapulus caudatus]|uniref:Signal peptidase complex subunit 3 n=1 Tax=Priapulus caudatus TaxID=37621 RepID=A0ABM1DXZ5_PRICU|nr:PREDICTED: signal peptidase complex subunit 3-like [Priapulus caudatus]
MNTFFSRLNAIFAFTLSTLAGLTFLCFITTAFIEFKPPVSLNTAKAIVKIAADHSTTRERFDLGFVNFDLQADLTPIFNWNVKQLFLYLTAEYETEKNSINQVVLWDKIIQRGENAVLDYRSLRSKYYFWDDGNGLRGNRNITLTLSWNIVPNSGMLPLLSGDGSHRFEFPSEYTEKM